MDALKEILNKQSKFTQSNLGEPVEISGPVLDDCGPRDTHNMVESNEDLRSVDVPVIFAAKATDIQIGGAHYKNMAIQPIDFICKNNIPYIEGNVIKYICRHRSKNGVQDLAKAKHYIDLLIQQYGEGK